MADRSFYEQYRQTPEGQALLRMLRYAEGTERGGQDSYRVMFGGSLAPDLKQHPDRLMKNRSTAAGAYQILTPTWKQQQQKLGLSSFGPVEQDVAALDLIRQRTMGLGGLSYVQKKGLTPEFVAALSPEWASLPTKKGKSYYGQPVKSFSDLQKVYQQGLKPLSGEQAQEGTQKQDVSSSGFFEGLLSAMSKDNTKDISVRDLLKQELMSQVLNPPTATSLINPFQMLLNYNPYS